jgi:hypothetical protein
VYLFVKRIDTHSPRLLVVDEIGDLKKSTHTVGVQRPYTGTAGLIENAQGRGSTSSTPSWRIMRFIDQALYLPKSWAGGVQRPDPSGQPHGRCRPPDGHRSTEDQEWSWLAEAWPEQRR